MSESADALDVPDGFVSLVDREHDGERHVDSYTQADGVHVHLVALYNSTSQSWTLHKKVKRDGEWKYSGWGMGLDRNGPFEEPDRIRYQGNRYVKGQQGLFTDLPLLQRILSAPLWGLILAVACIKGEDVNVQYLHDEEWTPEN